MEVPAPCELVDAGDEISFAGSLKDPIKCWVQTVLFSVTHPYKAPSYTWGDLKDRSTITLNTMLDCHEESRIYTAISNVRTFIGAMTHNLRGQNIELLVHVLTTCIELIYRSLIEDSLNTYY